jgi:hypothetical protein
LGLACLRATFTEANTGAGNAVTANNASESCRKRRLDSFCIVHPSSFRFLDRVRFSLLVMEKIRYALPEHTGSRLARRVARLTC